MTSFRTAFCAAACSSKMPLASTGAVLSCVSVSLGQVSHDS